MRWWLAVLFAGIAALTALIVAQVFRSSSESAIRDRAAELTAGTAVAVAARISAASSPSDVDSIASETSNRRRTALFVFDGDGRLLSADRSAGIALEDVPDLERALSEALGGRRFVEQDTDRGSVTVGLPIRGSDAVAGLVAFSTRPDLEDAIGIVHDEILSAALRATFIGAVVGLVVALLITLRLRRIAAAAAAIEQGSFEGSLKPRFPDELGALAGTVDQMRERLAESFANLEGERNKLHRLLEQLHEAVVAVDRELRIVFANSRARVLLGHDARPGRPLPDPWPDVSIRSAARNLFEPQARGVNLALRPDPATSLVLAGLPPSFGSDTAVLVIRDVTVLERRERAEREFVTNAAHELRTPLTAIASAVDVLQEGAKDDPEQRDRFLGVIERQTNRLNGLVRALLTLARAQTETEAVQLEPIPIAQLLATIAADTGQVDACVTVDCAPDVIARTQPELLRQALENLVENSITHGAGLDVRLSARPSKTGFIRVEVSDAGPGMTASDANRALDRFYRGANGHGGYGLGLAIVREVVRVIDGELSIKTAPGQGTHITIELPSGADGNGAG
jgi:two-component system, OmpR family, phosphate regulon sensor histidine kinase PhoR